MAQRKRKPARGATGVDPRNKLNELTNKQWMIETKSVWFSTPPPRDRLKADHPATFAEADVERLIRFFTKKGGCVLDPFLGTGSTLIAALNAGRGGLGIELSEHWADVARKRLAPWTDSLLPLPAEVEVRTGDARKILPRLKRDSCDFVVTSPPYWTILRKRADHKVKRERLAKGLRTRYSDSDDDLGNLPSYEAFLKELGKVFRSCYRVLKPGRYLAVLASDFRDGSRFHLFHADIARICEKAGYTLEGITILAQDSKNLYPYGVPYRFVSNVNHQNIVILRKPDL